MSGIGEQCLLPLGSLKLALQIAFMGEVPLS